MSSVAQRRAAARLDADRASLRAEIDANLRDNLRISKSSYSASVEHSAYSTLTQGHPKRWPEPWASWYVRRAEAMGGVRLPIPEGVELPEGPFPVDVHARAMAELRAEARRVLNRFSSVEKCHKCWEPARFIYRDLDIRDFDSKLACEPDQRFAEVAYDDTGAPMHGVGWVRHVCAAKSRP